MRISTEMMNQFSAMLNAEGRSRGTVEKYLRDVRAFAAWMDDLGLEEAVGWREYLVERGYAAVTVNSMLSAVNRFLRFLGREDCKIKFLRVQRKAFREEIPETTKFIIAQRISSVQYADEILILDDDHIAGRGLELLMETICATGIRVSEVRYITVEAANRAGTDIRLKGKIRDILIPNKLRRKLLKYARKNKIASGEIFLTGSGKSLSRGQIWREMKAICKKAGVEESKVFPHNLRHLFATTFYKVCKDIVKLADVLGHSSINTTRIYLMTSGAEHARQLEKLGLVT